MRALVSFPLFGCLTSSKVGGVRGDGLWNVFIKRDRG
jgi:hypothetical protein